MQPTSISPAQMKANLVELQAYELPEPPIVVAALKAPMRGRFLNAPANTPDASVISNGVVSFVGGMREQNKEDVRNSYLFASLVASKQYPSEADGVLWYERFSTVMNQLGWIFIHKRYSRQRAQKNSVTMDQVGFQTLGSALAQAVLPGGVGTQLLSAASAALGGLKKSANDKPLSLFNRNASKPGAGHFTLGACIEDALGEVSMAFGAVHRQSKESKGNVLFGSWNNESSDIYTGEARMVLHDTSYARSRVLILERLGRNIEAAIASYDI